jgi:ubiquitin carboxyl-terminal hydrolase 1
MDPIQLSDLLVQLGVATFGGILFIAIGKVYFDRTSRNPSRKISRNTSEKIRRKKAPKKGSPSFSVNLVSKDCKLVTKTSNQNIDDEDEDDDNEISTATIDFKNHLALPLVHGLYNVGNTCFFNSVVQCFASLTVLHNYLDLIHNIYRTNDHDAKIPCPVSLELLQLLESLRRPIKYSESISPIRLMRALNQVKSMFNMSQQDAQELFQLVSSVLVKEKSDLFRELNPLRPSLSNILSDSLPSGFQGLGQTYIPFGNVSKLKRYPLEGILASRFACVECGYCTGIRHFPFDNLTLTLPQKRHVELAEVLQDFTQLEDISGATCRRCSLNRTAEEICQKLGSQCPQESLKIKNSKAQNRREHENESTANNIKRSDGRKKKEGKLKHDRECILRMIAMGLEEDELPSGVQLSRFETLHTKQLMVVRAPHALVLHLVRSTCVGCHVRKNSCFVRFPEFLDIGPFCTGSTLESDPIRPLSPGWATESAPKAQAVHSNGNHIVCSYVTRKPSDTETSKELPLDTYSAPSLGKKARIEVLPKAASRRYRLQGTVVHYGSHDYGHYVAYRRSPHESKCWLRISDDEVSFAPLQEVLGSGDQTVMLFYEAVSFL